MTKIIRTLTLGLTVLALAVLATPAFAVNARAEAAQQTAEEKRAVAQTRAASKLDDAKQKVCKNREASIKKIASNIQERATRQLDVFGKIADRTMKFYEDKQYSVATYDDLVATVNDKRAAAEQAVKDVSGFSESFSCTSDNAATFKDDVKSQLQAEQAALKEYKTAIKDLIVGVKSANSQDKTTDTTTGEQQ
ncbi:MAG: hypothetical protein WAT17_04600 [Candidatus Saccharimonadales bacterium]|jgi:hypothetical protein